ARARHRPRRPARHRAIEPARLRRGRGAALSRGAGRDRRRHAGLPRGPRRACRGELVHDERRGSGSRARARRPRLRAHQPLRRFDFTAEHLATVLRLASYSAEYAALLPLLLGEAASRADYAPLAAQFLLIERAYAGAVATGMHDSVVCTEDVPFYRVSARERTRLADTFLG